MTRLEGLPAAQKTAAIDETRRTLYRSSLFLTARYALGYSDMTVDVHQPVCAALEAPTRRKLLVLPRGTFKTSLASVAYPIWCLENNANLRILLDSELYSNSKNILREIKAHYESERFRTVFGNRVGTLWNEGEATIASRTVVKKEASLTCSGIGAQKTGQHYDVIVADDMNSPKNSGTPEGCQRVIDHYRYYTSLLEPDGIIVVVGTRYSAQDLIAFILKNELGIDESQIGDARL